MIEKIKITSGVYWIAIKEADIYILCGCPADCVKHMIKIGLIRTVEKNGVTFETGPNVILLADVLVQKGHFSNLAEFPVLQMLYKQGMILPNHPNNTGVKPLLIGTEKQIHAQMEYIYRGNYGLTSEEEIVATGVPVKQAKKMMRLKLKFAFGKIRKTEELLDHLVIEDKFIEIRNDVFVKRIDLNKYEFKYKEDTIIADMNLYQNESYIPPYELGFYQTKREYFSVVHSGEGDGWDPNRPCMASILFFQGKIYLLDAGPNIMTSLMSLGINANEIEGIFHTHSHDDHFCGLTALIRADHRLKYFSSPLIRASVSQKLAALMSWEEDKFDRFFEVHDLELNKWNNIDGLEVLPTFSPHPVEAHIFIFRSLWEGGYRTYGHFADIASLDTLQGMITDDPTAPGISQEFFNKIKSEYLSQLNLKKVDAGGGMIHGEAEDFREDKSDKVILCHQSTKLTVKQKQIGSSSPFGTNDVLIPSKQDYGMRYAARLLRNYFPNIPFSELNILLNCDLIAINAGTLMIKEGDINDYLYLTLTGMVESIQTGSGDPQILSAGSIIGEFSGVMQVPSMETYYAESYITALKIPSDLYHNFVERNGLYHEIETFMDNRIFLQTTWLFGELISYPILNKIAQAMVLKLYNAKEQLQTEKKLQLLILAKGEVIIKINDKPAKTLKPGDFIGEETVLYGQHGEYEIYTSTKCKIYHIPCDILTDIPVIQWKLMEYLEKRFS